MADLVSNRRAFYDYEILDRFEAGIALLGTEIKSLRNHGGSLQDAYVDQKGDELWLVNATIAPYAFGNIQNHPEKRERKLLLHRQEINQISAFLSKGNGTVIPLSIFLNKRGLAKVMIGLAKGKKQYDKRASIKKREETRAIQREMRS